MFLKIMIVREYGSSLQMS